MTSGHDFILQFAVRGANPTLLCVSIYDATSSTWVLQNFQPAALDTESILQVKNPAGIMNQNSVSNKTVSLVTIASAIRAGLLIKRRRGGTSLAV
jgi:hypothetical protein